MRELSVNRKNFDAIVEKMISNIKEREVNIVNGKENFNGLFDDQIYELNAVDFIDGLEERDSYLAFPVYTDGHLSGIFLDDYSNDEDGNHEWLPSMEVDFNLDQLGKIQVEINQRKENY